jgi:hypothetical protein
MEDDPMGRADSDDLDSFGRLEGNIREELNAQSALANLGRDDDVPTRPIPESRVAV